MISQPVSLAAFCAPAWIDFQNSCVVPLGMTAICFDEVEALAAGCELGVADWGGFSHADNRNEQTTTTNQKCRFMRKRFAWLDDFFK
jgi:hypothetical protein